jgi:hypothetical protein
LLDDPDMTTSDYSPSRFPGHDFKQDLVTSECKDAKPLPAEMKSVYQVPQKREVKPEHRNRACESSNLTRFAATSFVLVAEGFPVWALCLERLFCSSLYVPEYANEASFLQALVKLGSPVHLWKRVAGYLGYERIHFGCDGPIDSLHLCSGSVQFLGAYCKSHPSVKAVLMVDDAFMRSHKRLPEGTGVAWHRVLHVEFGGATKFETLVGYKGLVGAPARTRLRRTIGDFVEYGLDSTAFRSQPEALEVSDLLNPRQLDQPVRYPSGRSRNGSITRALVPEELGLVFGLPTWIRSGRLDEPNSFNIIPIQILDGCLKPVLRQASPQKIGEFNSRAPTRAVDRPRPAAVWFESIRKMLPGTWIDETLVTDKAAKSDTAGVPCHLWDQRILLIWPHLTGRLEWLRGRLMHLAMRNIYREFREFMSATHGVDWSVRLRVAQDAARHNGGLEERDEGLLNSGWAAKELLADAQAGRRALLCFGASSWWDWKGGSTLNFWRWPEGEQRKAARDGMKAYIFGQLPRYRRASRSPKIEHKKSIFEKIVKVLRRGYLVFNLDIQSLVDAFPVPKGDDIRMVYNGASCGLNEALWAPNFWLPKASSASRLLDYGYYSVDLDMGEMFPNFPLPPELRPYSGIDLTPFRELFETDAPDLMRDAPRSADARLWARWERNWMGILPSPYMSIRFFYWAEEFVRGNRTDPANALGWDKVKLNCPGSDDFDPTSARVLKWRSDVQRVANDIITFVDDVRASGWSAEDSWQVARQLASRLQYLGIQDAPRKRRPPCCDPGAWAGAIFSTLSDKITQTVSQAKWEKGRAYVQLILEKMIANPVDCSLSYKYLEQLRGFLVHLAMTFEFLKPYLKGLHHTLAYHLGKRDKLGWKRGERDWIIYVSHQVESGEMTQDEAFQALHPPDFEDIQTPASVCPLQRMREDFVVMNEFFAADTPPVVLLRCAKILYILYGFADASGSGFGSSFQLSDGLSLRIGTWGKDDEENSSNWREFENVVEALEDQAEKGSLADSVVYLATDNSTVEACAANGTSSRERIVGGLCGVPSHGQLNSRSLRGKWNIFEPKAAQLGSAPPQVIRGSSKAPQKCSHWSGDCVECSKRRKWTEGIFCANFYWSLNGYAPCRQMWCGKCYTSNPEVEFHVRPSSAELGAGGSDGADAERLAVAWKRHAQSPHAFLRARDGDHFLVPFECDLCVFRKVSRRELRKDSTRDKLLMACIRRVNLDAFWSRTENTVNGNTSNLRKGLELSRLVGLDGPYVHSGPLPEYDHCGYEVAIQMVLYSRRPGVNAGDHLQLDTIRKLRTVYGNQARSAPQATRESLALGDQKGHYQRVGKDPSGSFWFSRFYQGCAKRMGQVWKPNRAMSIKLLMAVLGETEIRIQDACPGEELNSWVVLHVFIVVAYVVSLRGVEGLLLDLASLNLHWGKREDCITLALLGKIKGEDGDAIHLIPCVATTSSGIKVKVAVRRLMDLKKDQGLVDGPAISDVNGNAYLSRDIDDLLHEVLEDLHTSKRALFPPDVDLEDLQKSYKVFRTFRKTSDTRAMEKGVSPDDIDTVNRWKKDEEAGGVRPGKIMRHRYAQFDELLEPFLRYTKAM